MKVICGHALGRDCRTPVLSGFLFGDVIFMLYMSCYCNAISIRLLAEVEPMRPTEFGL
jgi:hypothetical protein